MRSHETSLRQDPDVPRVTVILGARPQFIKAAAVSRAISDHTGLVEVVIHTLASNRLLDVNRNIPRELIPVPWDD